MTVDIPEHNIVEPDEGETAIAPTCFILEKSTPDPPIDYTLTHNVNINTSTAIEGVDFTFPPTRIRVVANSIGNMMWCLNVTIIGNNEFDGNRRVNLDIFTVFGDAIDDKLCDVVTVNILEDDGRCK